MKSLSLPDDDVLVQNYCMNGDSCALGTILNRYSPAVFKFIRRYVRNPELSKDILQDTFEKAIDSIREGKYKPECSFERWILSIARQIIVAKVRKNEKEKNFFTVSISAIGEFIDRSNQELRHGLDPCVESVEEIIRRDEYCAEVEKLIKRLPEKQRQVIRLNIFCGCSSGEISEDTGVSVNTVKSRKLYAIRTMRKIAVKHNIQNEAIVIKNEAITV